MRKSLKKAPILCSPNFLNLQKAFSWTSSRVGFDENILVLVWLLSLPEGTTARALIKKLGVDRGKLMDALHGLSNIHIVVDNPTVECGMEMSTDMQKFDVYVSCIDPGAIISCDVNSVDVYVDALAKIEQEFDALYRGPETSPIIKVPAKIDPLPNPDTIRQAAALLGSLANELPTLRYRNALHVVRGMTLTEADEEKYLKLSQEGAVKEAEHVKKVSEALLGALDGTVELFARHAAKQPKEQPEPVKFEPLCLGSATSNFIEAMTGMEKFKRDYKGCKPLSWIDETITGDCTPPPAGTGKLAADLGGSDPIEECPLGHHKLEGDCRYWYCSCQCTQCVKQCEECGY